MQLTFKQLADAYVIATPTVESSALGRIAFWCEHLGRRPVIAITPDEVDAALAGLAARGRLRPDSRGKPVPTGKPLKGSTVNRYITTAQSLFKYARRQRMIPRS